MSLIEEDGTGKATAESLCTVTFADTYHTARGNTPWLTITTAQKEQALRRATEFMTQAYTSRWQGLRVYPTVQALDWPRQGVIVDGVSALTTIVPEVIKRATAELALKAAAGALYEDLTQGVTSETVGAISVTYDKTSNRKTKYTAVEAMLQPYLKSGGSVSMGLVRS
jgi:hypothetical protein